MPNLLHQQKFFAIMRGEELDISPDKLLHFHFKN